MIELEKVKCFYKKGVNHRVLDMNIADNQHYRNLLVSVIIAFERVKERAPKFVVFNDTLPHLLRVLIFRDDIQEEDLFNDDIRTLSADSRLICIQQDLDAQAEANRRYINDSFEVEDLVKFELL